MSNNSNGKTWPDLISEFKPLIWITFFVLMALAIYGICNRWGFKYGSAEFIPPSSTTAANEAERKDTMKEKKWQPQQQEKNKPKVAKPNPVSSSIQTGKIENHGNLSMGQTGGTVHQTTVVKPPPRHLTIEDQKSILKTIPSGYKVIVSYPYANEEATRYTLEILTMLNKEGYSTVESMYGHISPDLEENFSITINDEDSTAKLIIYRLK